MLDEDSSELAEQRSDSDEKEKEMLAQQQVRALQARKGCPSSGVVRGGPRSLGVPQERWRFRRALLRYTKVHGAYLVML